MKNKIIYLSVLVILSFLLVGCTTYSKLNEIIKIDVNKSIKVKDNEKELEIKFESAIDNRCKEEQQCIRSGEIEYKILINDKTAKLDTIVNRNYEFDGYSIKLADNNDSDKYINIIVTKK